MRLSSTNLELLRTRPQQTRLYLSIFQPREVLRAQVNDASIAKGARTITYDNVSGGAFGAVEAGMTLLVGTAPGKGDVGKIRIRSATASQFTISENSNIAWANDLYLTVLRYFELWPIYPRIIQDPADADNVLFYKDYDISYTNQNAVLGTYVCAGPHRAAFRENGQATLFYSSTGTFNILGDSLTYEWAFEGGSPTGSTSANPGNVTYSTPGHYVQRLIVRGSANLTTDIRYVYVSIYDKPGEGSNPPVLKWELTSDLSCSRNEGGYRASFRVYEDVPIDENAVVVLFADDWYGGTNQSLGGNYSNAEKIFFVGHILKDSIRYNYEHSFVEFDAASMTELMKQSLGFSVSVESKVSPSKWYELLDMNGKRALFHYLRWHTTAMNLADFQFVGTDYPIQFFDADRASMFDAIDNFMRVTLLGQVVSDRQGKVWMEVGAEAYPNPTGSFTSVMDISKRDWMGEPYVEERLSDDISYLELNGIAYSGVNTGTFSALIASAPGNAPSFRGSMETHPGLAVASHAQLNQMAGNVWANRNSPYPKINMDMAISARNLDIAPQETVNISILASDTVRNLAIQGLYIPSAFSWRYNAQDGILLPSIEFINLVNGNVGDTVDMGESDVEAGLNTGFQVPGLQIPPLPFLTIPPLLAGLLTGTVGQSIVNFQADYAYASYHDSAWTTGARGMTVFENTITASIQVSIKFTGMQSGIYWFAAGVTSLNSASNTYNDSAILKVDGNGKYVNAAQNEGSATQFLTASISGIIPLSGGNTVEFVNNPSINLDLVTSASLSLIRISA